MDPFFDALVRYETELWNLIERELANDPASSVGLARLEALRVVDAHGGAARVQDIKDDLVITVGAASKLVDRLERDGLVERRPNPGDRRSALVSLTAEGADARAAAEGVAAAALARHLAAAGVDTAALTVDLTRLRAALMPAVPSTPAVATPAAPTLATDSETEATS
jgi:DNA-binding MarR family transcriptional regulator